MVGRAKPDINNIFDKMEYMTKNHIQIPNQNGEAKLYLFNNNYFARHKRNRQRDIYDIFPIPGAICLLPTPEQTGSAQVAENTNLGN